MNRVSIVSLGMSALAIMVAVGCKKDGESKPLEDRCLDDCNRMFEECGDEYIAEMVEWGREPDSDDLIELQDECKDSCDDAEEQADIECVKSHLTSECGSRLSTTVRRGETLERCLLGCREDLDCTTLVSVEESVAGECHTECVDQVEEEKAIFTELEEKCESELAGGFLECKVDDLLGLRVACAPRCEMYNIGDGFCDDVCNNEACQYDGGDCAD